MNKDMMRRVRSYFYHEMAPRHVARHNFRSWVKSVQQLGDKHVIRDKVPRKVH